MNIEKIKEKLKTGPRPINPAWALAELEKAIARIEALEKVGAIFKRMMDAHIANIDMVIADECAFETHAHHANEEIVVECVKQMRYLKALGELEESK